jgi:antitoxin MazE
MKTTIQKWGNSQAIRIPKPLLEEILLKENDPVDIEVENDAIIIRKAFRKRRAITSLQERMETYYGKPLEEILADETLYSPVEMDWGKPVGKEVW